MDRKDFGLLTSDEVANIFGIKKSSLAVWRSKRKIPYFRTSRNVYYKESDIKAFIESCRVEMKDN